MGGAKDLAAGRDNNHSAQAQWTIIGAAATIMIMKTHYLQCFNSTYYLRLGHVIELDVSCWLTVINVVCRSNAGQWTEHNRHSLCQLYW